MTLRSLRLVPLFIVTVLVAVAQNANLHFTIATNPSIGIGVPANLAWTVTGGTPPYTVTLLNPAALPPGLTFNTEDSAITGTPTQLGAYSILITATDSLGNLAAANVTITVAPPIAITTASLPPATAGQSYAQQLAASGGAAPYTWALAGGTLPPGFRMDTKGIVGGVASASASGAYSFSVSVTDAQGKSATAMLSIQIQPSAPVISPNGIGNAAAPASALSPGGYATITGTNFAAASTSANGTPLPVTLGGVTVTVNGVQAPLLFVSPTQINFQVPFSIAPGPATVAIASQGVAGGSMSVNIVPASPGIFQTQTGRALALNQDGSLNDPSRPARAGTVIVLFATGGGRFSTDLTSGGVAPTTSLVNLLLPASVTIGGQRAEVLFAGAAPGEGTGTIQINARIPAALAAGDYPVVLSVGEIPSNAPLISVSAQP